jgi:hypothetical protein
VAKGTWARLVFDTRGVGEEQQQKQLEPIICRAKGAQQTRGGKNEKRGIEKPG